MGLRHKPVRLGRDSPGRGPRPRLPCRLLMLPTPAPGRRRCRRPSARARGRRRHALPRGNTAAPGSSAPSRLPGCSGPVLRMARAVRAPPDTVSAIALQTRRLFRKSVRDGTFGGGSVLRGGGVPRKDPDPPGLRLLRMTGIGWGAVLRRRRRRHRVGGWDTASARGTASPSSRGPRGGVPRGGAAAAGGAASRAVAEGARAVPRRDAAWLRSGRRKAADASMASAEPTSRAAVGALGAIRDRIEEGLIS